MVVALFGGSFDPPHLGHESAVKKITEELNVDRVFVVPTFINPFKKESFAPAPLRLLWCQKIFSSYNNVSVLDYEIRQNRAVATIDTVTFIKNCYKPSKIYLIIGADNLSSLHLWHRYEELKDLVSLYLLTRKGYYIPKGLKKIDINVNISSLDLRANFQVGYIPIPIKQMVQKYFKENNGKPN